MTSPRNFLLLRGLVRERRHWREFPRALERALPGTTTYFLDFPGVGSEWRRASPLSIAGIREDLARRFEQKLSSGEFPGGSWNLLAVSMGAMVGMDWIASGASPFENAIFANSSARDLGPFWERFRPQILPGVGRSLLDFRPEIYERVILAATSNLAENQRFKPLDEHIAWRKESPLARATFFAQILAASRFRLPQRLPIPGLILLCEKDRLVSPRLSEKIAERFGYPVARHPWAGHDLTLDDPEWVAVQIARYFEAGAEAARATSSSKVQS